MGKELFYRVCSAQLKGLLSWVVDKQDQIKDGDQEQRKMLIDALVSRYNILINEQAAELAAIIEEEEKENDFN